MSLLLVACAKLFCVSEWPTSVVHLRLSVFLRVPPRTPPHLWAGLDCGLRHLGQLQSNSRPASFNQDTTLSLSGRQAS